MSIVLMTKIFYSQLQLCVYNHVYESVSMTTLTCFLKLLAYIIPVEFLIICTVQLCSQSILNLIVHDYTKSSSSFEKVGPVPFWFLYRLAVTYGFSSSSYGPVATFLQNSMTVLQLIPQMYIEIEFIWQQIKIQLFQHFNILKVVERSKP